MNHAARLRVGGARARLDVEVGDQVVRLERLQRRDARRHEFVRRDRARRLAAQRGIVHAHDIREQLRIVSQSFKSKLFMKRLIVR